MRIIKNINRPLVLLCFWLLWCGCTDDNSLPIQVQEKLRATENGRQILRIYSDLSRTQKGGALFLLNYMPQKDIDNLPKEIFRDNIIYAYKALEQYEWCRELPDSIFYNYVLPYANLTERRDNWRPLFYKTYSAVIDTAKNGREAIKLINHNIQEITQVDYNTNRPHTDMSPFESLEYKMATCTGLSILLVNSFRSVGIPARFVGILNWTSGEGNHSWVEVYIDGEWHFTEYYPDPKGLDHAWFTERSVQSIPDRREHSIWALSYKKTDESFPLVWDSANRDFAAINVTYRYVQTEPKSLIDNKNVKVRIEGYDNKFCSPVYANTLGQRRDLEVLIMHENDTVWRGKTASATDDANKYLTVALESNKEYTLRYIDVDGKEQKKLITPKEKEELRVILQ